MNTLERLQRAVDRFSRARILVLGDVIVDQFIWGSVSRISPEAPVPVVNVTREEFLLGGSANVLKNIFSLGGNGTLCAVIGRDAMADKLTGLVRDLPAPVDGLVRGERITTVKSRVVAQGQQVVRFDREECTPLADPVVEEMGSYLERHLRDFDAVVVSDYAKGVVNASLMARLRQLRRQIENEGGSLPLVVDPKPVNLGSFVGATVITPNNLEAGMMSGIEIRTDEQLLAAATTIRDEIDSEAVLVTRGEAGMALLEEDGEMITIPTAAREVFDVTGAGDTVAATLALGLATGCSMREAAILANHAAGIVVGKIGTASVGRDELDRALLRTGGE